MILVSLYLSSGLFLGWSLGANDASNVFGTAVETRMIRFRTAALICSFFVLIGAVIAGAGASHTLGKLGAVTSLGGAFTVTLATALAVFLMTKARLPVSTSQAIIGGIIGWNIFTGQETDLTLVRKIVSTWLLCPLIAAGIAALLFFLVRFLIKRLPVHLLSLDRGTRIALILAGAFGSFSLGANNIANVMGVFLPAVHLNPIDLGLFRLSSAQQLFFLGGLAISAGIITYSRKVMKTVGNDLFKLSPPAAFIAVLSHSLVLFLFASQGLRDWLLAHGLPAVPLVPVSSSQAIIGAVLGIGLAKNGGRNIRFGLLGKIAAGWAATPLLACALSLALLFVMKQVFEMAF